MHTFLKAGVPSRILRNSVGRDSITVNGYLKIVTAVSCGWIRLEGTSASASHGLALASIGTIGAMGGPPLPILKIAPNGLHGSSVRICFITFKRFSAV